MPEPFRRVAQAFFVLLLVAGLLYLGWAIGHLVGLAVAGVVVGFAGAAILSPSKGGKPGA